MQAAPAAPAIPTPPAVPKLTPGQVVVGGQPIASAYDVYQGFKAQRRELGRQLESLTSQRQDIANELANPETAGADKKGLESRITQMDQRISELDKAIADADAQVAKAAAVPGAAIDPPEPPRTGPPEEAFVLGGMFIVVVFLPLSIAFARRIWRRSAKVITTIPKELTERMTRVEQIVEASAIEIERIGEGQRFMTRIFTEGNASHGALSAGQTLGIQASRPGDVRP
jgi:hypothetical protein